MKKFCEYHTSDGGKCSSEAKKRCRRCKLNCCSDYHLRVTSVLDAEKQSFSELREALSIYLIGREHRQHSVSYADEQYMNYRNFYDEVVAKSKIPRITGKFFCPKCYEQETAQVRVQLERDFLPILKEAQDGGLVCGVQQFCYEDARVEWRCSVCNTPFCYGHGVKCKNCSEFFCFRSEPKKCTGSHHHGLFWRFRSEEERARDWLKPWG